MTQAMAKNPERLDGDWLALALDVGGIGAFDLNLATGEMIVSASGKAIFGRAPHEAFTREDFLAAIHPEDRDQAALALECAALGQQGLARRDEIYRVPLAGGERRIELKGRAVSGGQSVHVIGVMRDATACYQTQVRLESLRAELLRVARANDLGAMASALAHELNQPLAAASNYLHAAERLFSRDPAQALNAITKAEAQFVRTKDIIQRIRGFVGQGTSEHKPEDIELTCREVLDLARMTARYDGVALFLKANDGLPPVAIDKVQIQQVLLNLLRNAVEAMGTSDTRRVTISAAMDGEAVKVAVADTGPGLAPEIAAHLFQPFHSTKDGGMGVGLSLCRKIVDAHGGRLWLEPGEGGATFAFTVPVADVD